MKGSEKRKTGKRRGRIQALEDVFATFLSVLTQVRRPNEH